jgi:hypothetical protein
LSKPVSYLKPHARPSQPFVERRVRVGRSDGKIDFETLGEETVEGLVRSAWLQYLMQYIQAEL